MFLYTHPISVWCMRKQKCACGYPMVPLQLQTTRPDRSPPLNAKPLSPTWRFMGSYARSFYKSSIWVTRVAKGARVVSQATEETLQCRAAFFRVPADSNFAYDSSRDR